ncbi:TKL/TKL-UNIQUE protein kinase [Aphanomyces invadans]|uniref:TKL/TKL-UNIQUE protein kinase n=1 Tax=Aphanomyces invadans TaxID=157072 RepID=A0A024TN83_9STRA|nr:TKL/TKL-UNIQUE protein kinase [Aphanomyces invadans]ETV95620.1 TKL/TKL-UNIQUE protein kinase [Aphanomyces invadans]|eukprot:XP_008875813.1 TKL/TKL-UNIQUE protein kinase [Aphanomyces invadans]
MDIRWDLRVHVYEAKGLMDRGGPFMKQSPYCTIKIAGQKFKTNVHMDGGCNPVFNQELTIHNVMPKDDFQIEVKGHHTNIPKTHLGVFRISLEQAMLDGRTGRKVWCPLKNVKKAGKDAGQLCLRLDVRNAPPPYIEKIDALSLTDSHRPTENSLSDHPPPRRKTYSSTQLPPTSPQRLKNAFSAGEHDEGTLYTRGTSARDDFSRQSRPPSALRSTLRRTLSQDEVDWTGYEELRPYAKFYVYSSQVSIIRQVHTDYIQTDYMKTQLGHYGGDKVMITSAKVPAERQALIKEVIALSKVDCPLILPFVGFFIDQAKGGLHCITNHALANPPTLHKYVQRMGSRLTLKDKLAFAIDVAMALVYMHQLGMMHRGIKAENVMLTDRKKAVLSGFGTCRDRSYDQTLTVGVGDIQWSAPEMLTDGDYIEKVDVYSFGVLLVELETGQKPFEEESKSMTRNDLTNAILMGTLRPTPSPACPSSLNRLIRLCLQHDPRLRPAMDQVLSSLQDISNTL